MSEAVAAKFRRIGTTVVPPRWLAEDGGGIDDVRFRDPRIVPTPVPREALEGVDAGPIPGPAGLPTDIGHHHSRPPTVAARRNKHSSAAPSIAPRPPTMRPPTVPPRRDETEFARAALELATARAQVVADVEGELITLALAVAEAIVEREVERDPLLHKRLALTALAVVQGAETAVLRCAPEACDAVVAAFGANEIDVGQTRTKIIRDETLRGLGVVVDAGATRVDGTLRERLHDVWRAIELERKRDGEEAA